jgi:hypothetical protein
MFTAAAVASQVAEAQAPPAAPAKATADQDFTQAQGALRANAVQLSRIKVPMAVEPAFRFKA